MKNKHKLNDQNVIARWSSRGMTAKQMAARTEADMNEFIEEKIQKYELDMHDLGADPAWVAERMAQQRIEFAKWKTEKLRYLERWFARGGETLN
jgi:hypothetical protein